MRLDPERPLAPATIDAIRDLLGPRDVPTVDDSALLAMALGVADAPTRLACARAMLACPSTRARLLAIRASVSGTFAAPTPDADDREDLRRLSVFAAPFEAAAAAATFPQRFGERQRLRRLAEGGWLEVLDPLRGPFYRVPGRFRNEAWTLDAEAKAGFVRHFAEAARWIDRTIAEGRWAEADERLTQTLPDLRAAWRFADEASDFEAVSTFVDSLAAEFMESGRREALADLAGVAYRASDVTGDSVPRSRLLSYEGALASKLGDTARAVELWSQRVELNRQVGNPRAEADSLLDLVGEAIGVGDREAWERLIGPTEDAVARAERADLTATLWIMHANERVFAGDRDEAMVYAERAMAVYAGNLGLDTGLFIQTEAAKILASSGRSLRAIGIVANLLDLAVQAGRPTHAAAVLNPLGNLLEAEGRIELAERCVRAALAIYRHQGSRHVARTEARLAEILVASPTSNIEEVAASEWQAQAIIVLTELREGLAGVALA